MLVINKVHSEVEPIHSSEGTKSYELKNIYIFRLPKESNIGLMHSINKIRFDFTFRIYSKMWWTFSETPCLFGFSLGNNNMNNHKVLLCTQNKKWTYAGYITISTLSEYFFLVVLPAWFNFVQLACKYNFLRQIGI